MSAMTSMWLYFTFSLFCAWMSMRNSRWTVTDFGEVLYSKRDSFYYFLLVTAMSLFVGLRIWCNDTDTYRMGFESISANTPLFSGIKLSFGAAPIYEILNRILKKIGCSSQDYFMIYSFLTNGIYIWFVRKYSKHPLLSVFLLWTMGVYLFTAAGLRQAVSVAFGCLAVDRAMVNKWKAFVFWILVGCCFHPYLFVFGCVPFCRFKPWTKRTWFLLCGALLAGIFLQSLLGIVFRVTDLVGKSYGADTFSGDGVNVFRLLVSWAPIVLSLFVRNEIREEDKIGNLILNLSMVNAMIMFVALFGTANYFVRLANYFLIFQTISVPWIISLYNRKNQRTLYPVVTGCYLLYFYYANVVLTNFNRYFAKMTLWEYLEDIVGRL